MNDLIERLRRLYAQAGTDYVQEAADEIERLRACNTTAGERISYLETVASDLRRRAAEAENERDNLRAALVAAMEVVLRERVRIAYNAKGAPPTIEIGYADILRRLDAVIAQADAALK